MEMRRTEYRMAGGGGEGGYNQNSDWGKTDRIRFSLQNLVKLLLSSFSHPVCWSSWVFFFHLFFIASSLHSLLFSCHVISKRQGLKIWETLIQSVQIDYTIYKYVRHYKCKYVDIYQICSSAVDWLVSLRVPQCLCVCVCVCVCVCLNVRCCERPKRYDTERHERGI